jgi:hypothetical protein
VKVSGEAARILIDALISRDKKMRVATALLALAIALLVLPAAGQAAGPGAIRGTVTAEGGGAVVGIEVCAFGISPTEGGECAETTFGGAYNITGLSPGQYKVIFFGQPENYVEQTYKGSHSQATATPVPVGTTVVTGIDAELEKGASIAGTVTAAATGLPVAGVVACAESSVGEDSGCAETDAAGHYVIKGLPSAAYEIEFWSGEIEQNLLTQYYPGLVYVAHQQEVTGIDAALQAGGQISGTVRAAATGAPLGGVDTCIVEADEAWASACLKTPASGRYRFYGIPTGTYKIVFSPEASELLDGQFWEIAADAFPTQWWNGQPTFATATPIAVTAPATVEGIDGSLGPGPVATPTPAPAPASSPPAAAPVAPKMKPVKCRKGLKKKTANGRTRCVKVQRHKPRRHHRKHHPKRRGPAKPSR